MVAEVFDSLLKEVGRLIGLDLKPDDNRSCLLKISDDVSIQMNMDATGQHFIIGADLGPIPMGRYRQDLFLRALQSNDILSPKQSAFAFSKQKGHLVLFKMLPIQELKGDKIVSIIMPLVEKAQKWKNAIAQGEIPEEEEEEQLGNTLSSLFGLK